jgi:hypothetical protein
MDSRASFQVLEVIRKFNLVAPLEKILERALPRGKAGQRVERLADRRE